MSTNITYLIKDAMSDNDIQNINNDIDDSFKFDIILYNFSSDKKDIIFYLDYKQNRLYEFLNTKFNYLQKNDVIEILNDIYHFKYNFLRDIENIKCYDIFYYKFNQIAKNIKYEYKLNRKYIKNMCY